MPIFRVRRFPVCPNCGSATAVAREVTDLPEVVKELVKYQPVKECLHCEKAWYEHDVFTREGQHKRVYHIIRQTKTGAWLENIETVTCLLPKPRRKRRL